jgi:putative oxygen-independent coproporphyrinogen III oxidase
MSCLPGLYVHVPFCRTKCPYCGFFSTTDLDGIPLWLEAVELEVRAQAELMSGFDTLYLGGGSPSSLPDSVLQRLLSMLRDTLVFADQVETTIEVNPGDLGTERAAWLRSLQINRVSLGVQSLFDDELSLLGRRHDARQARASIDDLRAAGFSNLGIDLIAGLPGQDWTRRLASVEQALELEPDHLSCYDLTIEPGTPLSLAVERGELTLPDDDILARGAQAVAELLGQRGYEHYEVSNYARSTALRSRHNQKYWRHLPYLGLGPAAHSFDGAQRWWNTASVTTYCERLGNQASPVEAREVLSDEQLRVERLGLGFRTLEGVALADLESAQDSAALLAQLAAEGLVTIEAERVKPTGRGLDVADGLARAFL